MPYNERKETSSDGFRLRVISETLKKTIRILKRGDPFTEKHMEAYG